MFDSGRFLGRSTAVLVHILVAGGAPNFDAATLPLSGRNYYF